MSRRIVLAAAALLFLLPARASAQIDAIIDAVVGAVEPTPVYDNGVKDATLDLAQKIDRLNRALFGGAEENTAAYRYANMYSELYDLTTAFSSFVDRTYSNAQRLERMYSDLEDENLAGYANKARDTWGIYETTVRDGSRVVAKFKKLFGDGSATNSEVRESAREAIEELERRQAAEDRRIRTEIETTELAAGLVSCAAMMAPSPVSYVEAGRQEYGTTLTDTGSSQATGTLGTVVMIIIGLACVIYGLFAGILVMKGTAHAETMLVRVILAIVISLVIILSVQHAM